MSSAPLPTIEADRSFPKGLKAMVTITLSCDGAHADEICRALGTAITEGNRPTPTEGKSKGKEGTEGTDYSEMTPSPAHESAGKPTPGTPPRK
jgi:hypothetical protein